MKSYRPILLCIFSAAMLALSFPAINLWGLAWVALIPLLAAIKDKGYLNGFLLGLLWGFVFFYSAISWLNAIAAPATVALVFYLSLYSGLFAAFAVMVNNVGAGLAPARRVSGRPQGPPLPPFIKAVLLAAGWVSLEFIRANLLTGFGWALLGYSQSSFLPAIQIADITGVYGVSFVVVFVNAAVWEFFFACHSASNGADFHRVGAVCKYNYTYAVEIINNRFFNLLLCLFFIISVFAYGFYRLYQAPGTKHQAPVKISLIQGNIRQSLKWDESYRQNIIETYFNLTKQAARDKPSLIIWPETAFPADFNAEPQLANRLFALAEETGAHLLVGANRYVWSDIKKYEYEKIYNSAFLISPDGKIKSVYDKLHLVPFGEFIPKLPRFLYKVLPEKINMVGDFTPGKEYTVFRLGYPEAQKPSYPEAQKPSCPKAQLPSTQHPAPSTFSVLICFEDAFPQLARRFAQNGAQFLVNITNDGWYGISGAPFQHAQASVFRAVENRASVVRVGNTGLSEFIDGTGRVTAKMPPFTAGYKTSDICIQQDKPFQAFYTKYGDVFAYLSIIISLLLTVGAIFNSKCK